MINNLTLGGRITKDPQTINFNTGSIVVFDLANDSNFKNKDGSKHTNFFRVVASGNKADFISRNCFKGQSVIVSGSINQKDYIKADGSKGVSYEISLLDIQLNDFKKDNSKAEEDEEEETEEIVEIKDVVIPEIKADVEDDDLPF